MGIRYALVINVTLAHTLDVVVTATVNAVIIRTCCSAAAQFNKRAIPSHPCSSTCLAWWSMISLAWCVTCSPITVIGTGGTSCSQQLVCCTNNSYASIHS
ncbi:hypothetical protein DFH07DRAFT_848101 [Mycena maculata]|uniref:Hydrophobin n=1 Tax=Mycena maculata TaxID=230809 RepID=A0AAD7HZX6_9AGAR|nr:hypothetical protein DFH07DRAFT_848101 [Mycena maculata]